MSDRRDSAVTGPGGVPRVVVVTRPSDYDDLLARHGTVGQAGFFLQSRGQSMAAVRAAHRRQDQAVTAVVRAIPLEWRRSRVDRRDLDRFLFEPGDIVVAVGRDGLVANLAKYLSGQRVIGINPDPERHDGVLVPHRPGRIAALLAGAASGACSVEERVMVQAATEDGQQLLALNEIFVGQRTHQSARYHLNWRGAGEHHSSSGLIATTGTGATGWARSVHRQRRTEVALPAPCEPRLAFFVREAFPSVATGTAVTDGELVGDEGLEIVSEMHDSGVVFGDGIESDCIAFHYGMRLTLRVATQRLCLVVAAGRARRRRAGRSRPA
ncbi:MAG: hypothetical protein AAGC55_18385, partial [Myxococcota bacterium]